MIKRYTASVMHVGVREDPDGLLVSYHDYMLLKTEIDRLKDENDRLQNLCDFLEGMNKE